MEEENNQGDAASSLERLLADEAEISHDLLFETLSPFVRIGRESGALMFTPEFSRLSNSGKVIVYLLARKAAMVLGVSESGERATPKEIAAATGIPYDSVKPTASSLARERVLARAEGQYYFPNYLLLRVSELIR